MIFALCIGVLSAFVILIAMWRIGIDKFMGYPAVMDVLVTVVLIWMLHGSYVGMVAAIIGGLTFSAMITVLRKARGYSRLSFRGWKHYDATWNNPLNKINLNNFKLTERKTKCLNSNYSTVWIGCIALWFALACVL